MAQREPIAIVRMASVLPGAPTADAFWKNVQAGTCSIRDVPEGRWDVSPSDIHDTTPAVDRTYARRGGFVEDFALDTARIRMDRQLLLDLDPLFQWVLHVGHEVTQGLKVPRERTGVALANLALPSDAFAQMGRTGWRRLLRLSLGAQADALPNEEPTPNLLNHFHQGLPAGLLAHALDLQGGTLGLDAACASSLYAIKLAIDQLQEGRVDAMIAGGVARTDHLCLAVGFSQLKAISRAGHSRPFDATADGLIPGEGCGLFYLRRMSDALSAREPIVAVIRGVGLSNDGKGRGVLVPMSEGQVRAMRAAYAEAGVEPASVGLVECHATGTPVGDAAEVATLKAVWGSAPIHGTAIGSAKSNIGHLLTAAGAAGLVKAASAVRDAVLPPTTGFTSPSAGTTLTDAPLYINTALRPWNQAQGPRRAAVSAFGFGGCNAHLILEEAPSARPAFTLAPRPSRPRPEPVAVVAMHSRFGQALNVDAYREAIFEGRSLLAPAPAGRWFGLEQNAEAMRPLPGAYVTDLPVPDPMSLKIPPAEIERMLPQQLMSILVADEMLANGDVLSRVKDRRRVGVIVGMSMESDSGDYAFRWATQRDARHSTPERAAWLNAVTDKATRKISAEPVLGFLANLIANRISSRFDLGGPSLSVSAEDASALKALESAVLMLRRHDVDAMVVGGVDLPGDLRTLWITDELQGWTRTEARPFDARADGSAPGEGAGMVVLKRLSDAQRDGDTVLAVLRGVGSASDGHAGTPGHPSERAYEQSLRRALEDADVTARHVQLLVAHGSGRVAEDTPEARALHKVFGHGNGDPHVALFTPKPVAGHAGAASGMQGVVAAVLALRHRAIPPVRGLEEPAEPELWKGSAFYASRKARPWLVDKDESPRRACVAGMSVDGNHVHVVLEEGPEPSLQTALGAASEALFVLRDTTREGLVAQLKALLLDAQNHALEPLARKRARAWVKGAPGLVVSLVAADHEDLRRKVEKAIRELGAGTPTLMDIHGVFFTEDPLARKGRIAFVFPGAGNAYAGMAREVVLRFPEQVGVFERMTMAARSRSGEYWLNPREVVKRRVPRDEMRTPVEMLWGTGYYTQMLADVLRHRLGIQPTAAVGYSLGESSGLFALGAWRDVDLQFERMTTWALLNTSLVGPMNAILEAWERWGHDVSQYRGKTFWGTYMVQASVEDVKRALQNEPLCHISIINAPMEVVIAGEEGACQRVVAALGATAHMTPFPAAVHVPEVVVVEDEYRRMNTLPTYAPPGVTYYSSGRGEPYEATQENVTQSIIDQAVNHVDFPKLINRVWQDGVRLFVEVGPRGSCTRWIGRILEGREFLAVAADRKGRSEFVNILHLAAQLLAHGVDVDVAGLYACQGEVPVVTIPERARRYPTAWALDLPPVSRGATQVSVVPPVRRPSTVVRDTVVPPSWAQVDAAAQAAVPGPPTRPAPLHAATPIEVPARAIPRPPPPPQRIRGSAVVLPPMGIVKTVPLAGAAALSDSPRAVSALPTFAAPDTDGGRQDPVTREASSSGPALASTPAAVPPVVTLPPLAPTPPSDLMGLFQQTFAQLNEAHRVFLEGSTFTNQQMARVLSSLNARSVDRVLALELSGGAHGAGWIRAEKLLDPKDPSSAARALHEVLTGWLERAVAGVGGLVAEPVLAAPPAPWNSDGGAHVVATVELHIVRREAEVGGGLSAVADGFVGVDGRPVYRLDGVCMRARPR